MVCGGRIEDVEQSFLCLTTLVPLSVTLTVRTSAAPSGDIVEETKSIVAVQSVSITETSDHNHNERMI